MFTLFSSKGEQRPLAMAKADHADAHKLPPPWEKDELAAVVTLKNPSDGLRCGFAPTTQRLGSAAAVLQYN